VWWSVARRALAAHVIALGDLPRLSFGLAGFGLGLALFRWKPGQSGNPKGMRPGSRHRATVFVEKLLSGEADALARTLIKTALAGDPACLKICFDRLVPPMKCHPIRFKLPALHTINDAQQALSLIIAGTANGTILSDEAATLASIVSSFVKTVEVAEIEARLAALGAAPGRRYFFASCCERHDGIWLTFVVKFISRDHERSSAN
jgi:hypothetical protein